MQQLIDMLNEKVKDFTLKGDYADFHEKVRDILSDMLQAYGLKYSIWYAEIHLEDGQYELLRYSVDFKKDKRTKESHVKGTFTNVRFHIVTKHHFDVTVKAHAGMTVL